MAHARTRIALSVASRFINAWFFEGSVDQSLSARAYIEGFSNSVWLRRRQRIDAFFRWIDPDHCAKSWAFEVQSARRTLEQNGAAHLDPVDTRSIAL